MEPEVDETPEDTTMQDRMNARAAVTRWVREELSGYADIKWNRRGPESITWDDENFALFRDQIGEKMHRAELLGITTPLGKQALLKALVTAFEMCVTMVVAGEELPLPARASGELE